VTTKREELRRLYEASTPGIWSANRWRICSNAHDPKTFEYVLDTATNNANRNQRNLDNADFIAAAHNEVPGLLDAAERLEAVERACVRCAGVLEALWASEHDGTALCQFMKDEIKGAIDESRAALQAASPNHIDNFSWRFGSTGLP